MKKCVVILLAVVLLFGSGCAITAPGVRRDTYVGRQENKQYDQRMYQARSNARHAPVSEEAAAGEQRVLVENSDAEIIDEDGYVNGLNCVFINDSSYDLRVDIIDEHGQLFTIRWIPPARDFRIPDPTTKTTRTVTVSGVQTFKLEAGYHRVRVFRRWDSEPWIDGRMGVLSDKTYHPRGYAYSEAAQVQGLYNVSSEDEAKDLLGVLELGDYFGGGRFYGN